ncbi:MAG: Na/Pi cotransporter family protein [Bacteroidaceae bacterium]|nr:Na/Pi cotransporter family protein [Bacteroidaceae bacterium]
MESYLPFLVLIGSVALLMYGMKVMSEGLQKMAGSKLRQVLGTMTTNRLTGVLTGAFITMSVQSSTATTVMTVSFVSAGLLTLAQAISVVMGANIGTTATAWIMVLGGSFDIKYIIYACIAIAMALIYTKKNRNGGEFLMGLCFMLLGLTTLKTNAVDMHLDQNQTVADFFASISDWGFGSYLLFLIIGGLLTCAVQSSAAIMAITMTLCSTGVLDIYMGIALVMGENIGTTITSNIVALSASTQARRAAMAHLIFNIFGVIWVLCIFQTFVNFVCEMAGYQPGSSLSDLAILNVVLAAFHTSFNVINTCVLIWFVRPFEKVVCWIIKNKPASEEDIPRLHFISGGLMSTAELSILEAKKEILSYAERSHRMFTLVQQLLHIEKDEDFNKLYSRIEKYENISDNMELEIADYLNKVSEGRLSIESKTEIQRMLREVTEIESICDSNYNIARTINRKRTHSQDEFTEKQFDHIHSMMTLTDSALTQMIKSITRLNEYQFVDLNGSNNIEHEINNYRSQLKNQNIIDVNNHSYDYQMGVYYMDIITECERLGDYVMNVIEAAGNIKEQKDDEGF